MKKEDVILDDQLIEIKEQLLQQQQQEAQQPQQQEAQQSQHDPLSQAKAILNQGKMQFQSLQQQAIQQAKEIADQIQAKNQHGKQYTTSIEINDYKQSIR